MNLASTFVFFIDRSLGSQGVVQTLRSAGACVEIHDDHFAANEQDAVWLAAVALRNWIIVTKDERIAFRKGEQSAIARTNARVFVFSAGNVSGHTTAEAFQKSLVKMNRFAQGNPAPFIAKVYKSGKVQGWKSRTELLKLLK